MARPTEDAFPAVSATPAELRPLDEVLASLNHPLALPTPEGAAWLGQCLMRAAAIIDALIEDAEITGSTKAVQDAKAWFADVGFVRHD